MNIVQLETDLRAATAKAQTLIEDTNRANGVDGHMSADQISAINALLAEAEGFKTKLDAAKEDKNLLARLDKLTGGNGNGRPAAGLVPRSNLSIGAQFVQSEQFQQLLRSGRGRGSQWTSGAVECFDPGLSMRATTLTEDPASGGKLLAPQYQPGIQPLYFKKLVIADLLASGTTDTNAIIYMIETTFTNAAAPVAEGAAKPESALVFDQRTDSVVKLAHWLPATEELLEDVAGIMAYIDARLRLGLALAEEDQLLNGNGTPPNLLGLMNRSGLATAVARTTQTNAEAILQQISAIATTAFVYPDGVVMNPTNWFTTVTMKDTTGQYFGGGPFVTVPTQTLWGLPVAVTPSIVANTALVGAYGTMAQVFRRGGVRVEASNSHQDYFIKNLVAIRCEERLALCVYRPGAFGKVTGLN